MRKPRLRQQPPKQLGSADDAGLAPLDFHAHDGPNNTFIAIRIINNTASPPVNLLWLPLGDSITWG